MVYKPTILNVAAGISLIGVLIYTMWNYKALSQEEGWGVIIMFGLAIIFLVAMLTDLLLQQFIKNRKVLIVVGLIIIIGISIAILKFLLVG